MNLKWLYILLIISTTSCLQKDNVKRSCNNFHYPKEVKSEKAQAFYKEAIWQIYKKNLLATDSFRVTNPFYVDSIFTEKFLYEFNLEFDEFSQKGDSLSFIFFFERGVSPLNKHYYYKATFWDGSKDQFEISGRFGFVHNRNYYSSEFDKYLMLRKDKISHSLRCLAEERGVLSP